MQAFPRRGQAGGDGPLSIPTAAAEEIVPGTVFCRGPIWYTYIDETRLRTVFFEPDTRVERTMLELSSWASSPSSPGTQIAGRLARLLTYHQCPPRSRCGCRSTN